ncbi:cytochrome c6, chloroplastic [Olea europaea subsp. europaea]|uniref:Cytochrome c-553 n=2 Tax=Olea europaea subsp. europaea TaxID=158383 RepID=A0A8S0Q411_OLEEU|nr:cytochrome c6, chloroplastic [Olea europaea subsp. europaea]
MQLLSATPSCAKSCSLSPPLFWQKMDRSGEGYKSVDKTQNEERKFLKCFVPPLMAAIVALSPLCNTPVSLGQTMDARKGATLFHRACIGCHDGGGNIIQPGATLFLKDLERNGVDKEEEIYQVTYYGKGRMPGFGENCTPRGQCTFGPRLQEDEIKLLAEFVKSQADRGWPSIETDGE